MPALWRDSRLYLLVLITLLLMALAYQVRLPVWVDIGALGDRAYLWASPLQEDSGFNGDEHLVAESYDYRWTKRVSWVRFPDMAWQGPFRVILQLKGWRPERQVRPTVHVWVNGQEAGRFQVSGVMEVQRFSIEAAASSNPDIEVLLETNPFTPGQGDRRILGVQLDWVRLDPLPGGDWPVIPPWRQLLFWGAALALLYAGLRQWLLRKAFWAGLALGLLIAAGLAFGRQWVTPYALWALYAAGAVFLLAHLDRILYWIRQFGRRAHTLPLSGSLVGAGTIMILGYIHWARRTVPHLAPRPDAVLLVVFVAAAILYALLTWDRPLARILARLDTRMRGPWLAGALLVLLLATITIREFNFIRELRFIGHADYADNAVVARNLLAGQGFTVDYVTQFFQTYPDLSHPQETWPLLQPVLIAPFFYLFGDSAFVAKIPNLLLQLALALALYALGTRLFDRRVALVAVFLTVLNPLIFRLIIFPTSDLAFSLFALLALGQFFWAVERERQRDFRMASYVWAGVWAGLMMLAKPNGALYVGICLLWDLFWRWREQRWQSWWRAWLAFGLPASLLFAPWVGRNLLLFGTPVYSTERFDAWILKYQEWEEIYRIYFDDVPERSWLLRYGFDRVLQAIGTEFRKWWYYFSRDSSALITLLGSALALGGLLSLRRRAGRLFSLVGMIFLLFGAFICTYWHVEERYFVPFIPWLTLLAARELWWVYDALAYRRSGKGRRTTTGFAWLGLLMVVLACAHMVAPFSRELQSKQLADAAKAQELRAYEWLAEHSEPDDVIMTRVPWQVTYYTQRRSVMIPLDGLEDTQRIIELYSADYLLMDGDARGKRAALNQALHDDVPWQRIYDQGGVQIYQLSKQ